MGYYKRKPDYCHAVLYTGQTAEELPDWVREKAVNRFQGATLANLCLITRRGVLTAWAGQDYIVRFADGSIDVFRKDAFDNVYEVAT